MPGPSDRIHDLEQAIDGLVRGYESPLEINNLGSAALPNKRAVIQALNHLKPLVYMGFYSQRSLNKSNLRYGLAEHVYPAYELLVEQIERAVSYDAKYHGSPPRAPELPSDVALRLLDQLTELRSVLNADVVAAYAGDPAARSLEEIVFSYPTVEAITTHRIAHALHREGVPIIPRIMSYHAHERTGVDIHPGATIDAGFFMDHGTGVVIGETANIGRNVKVYQGVTIGALSTRRAESPLPLPRKRHPTIEDDVTIYSGATILGGDTVIGKGSIIGGNQWIVKSVPPGSKIFGRAKEGE